MKDKLGPWHSLRPFPLSRFGTFFKETHFNYVCLQMAIQMTLLGWLFIADILDNPYGFNVDHDKNLEGVGFLLSGSLH